MIGGEGHGLLGSDERVGGTETRIRGSRASADGFLIDASVGLEFRPAFGRFYEEGEGGLAISIRTGYTFAPGDWDWKLHVEDEVLNGPDIGIEGFYIRLGIGGWGMREGEDAEGGR